MRYLGALVFNKIRGWFLVNFQEMNLALSKFPHNYQMIAFGIHIIVFNNKRLKGDVYGVNTVFYGNKAPIFSLQ